MAHTPVVCNKCGSTKNRKHGFAPNGIQRYWCRGCERVFQLDYVNHGSEPDIHERIVTLKMEGMGFRAIARTLKLSLPTVSKHLKKLKPKTHIQLTHQGKKRQAIVQLDEMWSFVGCKKQKRWLWCAYDIHLKRVIAHVFGCRGVTTLRRLLKQLKAMGCSVTLYCTDYWKAYAKELPGTQHMQSKKYTQAIERVFLSLRTALKRLSRRTICFSRSLEIHDKVIGEWLTRNHYNYYES